MYSFSYVWHGKCIWCTITYSQETTNIQNWNMIEPKTNKNLKNNPFQCTLWDKVCLKTNYQGKKAPQWTLIKIALQKPTKNDFSENKVL